MQQLQPSAVSFELEPRDGAPPAAMNHPGEHVLSGRFDTPQRRRHGAGLCRCLRGGLVVLEELVCTPARFCGLGGEVLELFRFLQVVFELLNALEGFGVFKLLGDGLFGC